MIDKRQTLAHEAMADDLCNNAKSEGKYLSLNNTSGWSDLYTSIDDTLIRQIARSPEPPPRPDTSASGLQPTAPPLPQRCFTLPCIHGSDNNHRYKVVIATLVFLLLFASVIVIACIIATNRHLSIHDLTKNGHVKGCSASHEYPDFQCRYIYEGSAESGPHHEWSTTVRGAVGEWIQIDFHKSHTVTSIKLLQRCSMRQQISRLDVYFDDDSTQELHLECLPSDPDGYLCANLYWQTLDIDAHSSSYMRLVITAPCDLETEYTGIREIEIFGY